MSKENGSSSNEFIPASAVREIKAEFEAIIEDQVKRIRKMQVSLDKFREDNEQMKKRMETIDAILAKARVIEEAPPRVIKQSSPAPVRSTQSTVVKPAQPSFPKTNPVIKSALKTSLPPPKTKSATEEEWDDV